MASQRFLADSPEWNEIGGSDVDGFAVRLYSNECTASETKGLFHVVADVIDFRNPKQPVLVNSVPVGNTEYSSDGHYFADDLGKVADDFLATLSDAREQAQTYDNFVRGLYMAPVVELYDSLLGGTEYNGPLNIQHVRPVEGKGGSHDDDDLTDVFGGLDLNTLLQ